MTRDVLPFVAPDLSQFARALGRALHERETPPGHVELLNLIARAAGHRNLQSLRAMPRPRLARPAEAAPPPDPLSANALKALQQFDAQGRLVRWPTKFSVQRLAMWVLWTRFDAARVYSEREVNEVLKAAQTFGDHVTLRRELINHRLMTRKSDCSEYRKLRVRADDEVRALLRAYRELTRPAASAGSAPARRSTR